MNRVVNTRLARQSSHKMIRDSEAAHARDGQATFHIPAISQNIERSNPPRSKTTTSINQALTKQPATQLKTESPRNVGFLTLQRARAANPHLPRLPHPRRHAPHNQLHPLPHPLAIQTSESLFQHKTRRPEETISDSLPRTGSRLLLRGHGVEVR